MIPWADPGQGLPQTPLLLPTEEAATDVYTEQDLQGPFKAGLCTQQA